VTDLRQLPDGWTWKAFDDVAIIASNLVSPAEHPDHLHLAPNHIAPETGRYEPLVTVTEDGVTSGKHLVRPGQIVYSKIRPYLRKATIAKTELLCSADMYPIETDLEPRYLMWWLMSGEFTALAMKGRSVIPKINQRELKALPVPVPPQAEQKAIVQALESMLSRLQMAGSVVESSAHRALQAERAVIEACLRGEMGGNVSSWKVRSLGELAVTVRNGGHWKAPEALPPGIPILRIGAVRPMRLNGDDRGFIRAQVTEDELAKFTVRAGSLLFTRYNGNPRLVGACARADSSVDGMLHPDKLIRVDLGSDALSRWVELAAAGGMTRQHIDRHVKTTAGQAGIAGRDIKTAPIPLPDLETQRVLADRVNSMITRMRHVGSQLAAFSDRATALRREILAAAFDGRLSVRSTSAPSRESRDAGRKLWSYCHVLRDEGVPVIAYNEQITQLLFLKMVHERTQPPFNQPSPVPTACDCPRAAERLTGWTGPRC
jgi:type I restriction enzyme, S subunit